MPPALFRPDFDQLEKESPLRQRKFFKDHKHEFNTEEKVSSEKKNILVADHLAVDRKPYTHHLICTGVDNGKIRITEFTFRVLPKGPGIVSADLGVFGIVKESEKTYEELEQEGVYKIKWPKALIRYDVQTIVQRARSRIGETCYSLLENNCEHLVSWCICGLNVSLQLEEWYFCIRESLYAAGASVKQVMPQAAVVKIFANISDELVEIVGKGLGRFGLNPMYVGFIIGGVLESGLALYEFKKAYKKWNVDHTYNEEEFTTKVVEILLKGFFRFGGGVLGSAIGISGGLVGILLVGAAGAAVGHLAGFGLSWCYKNRDWLQLQIKEKNNKIFLSVDVSANHQAALPSCSVGSSVT